jgi:hypothetical protein
MPKCLASAVAARAGLGRTANDCADVTVVCRAPST